MFSFAGIASLAERTDTDIFCIACKCSEEGSGLGFQVISSLYVKAGGTANLEIGISINGVPSIFAI